ncbi:unnamed protein product [Choristocarpus tenellus]
MAEEKGDAALNEDVSSNKGEVPEEVSGGEKEKSLGPSDYVARIQRGDVGESVEVCMSATVVKGFGRGSKLLGIPTANMDMSEVGHTVDNMSTGIYMGYTSLRGEIFRAVVSVGWNPYFDNKEKTVVSSPYSSVVSLPLCPSTSTHVQGKKSCSPKYFQFFSARDALLTLGKLVSDS